MLGDPQRGYLLECILAQLLFLRRRVPARSAGGVHGGARGGPQLVAMSATLSNAGELSGWLDAVLHVSHWRPTLLTAFVKHDRRLFRYDDARGTLNLDRELPPLQSRVAGQAAADPQQLGELCHEASY
eukprot:7380630-Prymnesium_polylepis.2